MVKLGKIINILRNIAKRNVLFLYTVEPRLSEYSTLCSHSIIFSIIQTRFMCYRYSH